MKQLEVAVAIWVLVLVALVGGTVVGELIDLNSRPTGSQLRRVCVAHEGIASVSTLSIGAEVFVTCRDGYGEWR